MRASPACSRVASAGSCAVVAARQVLADLDDLRRDQVEVVEEPLGGRRDEGAFADVLGQRAIGGLEDALVVAQPRIDAAGMAPARVDRETGGQGERPLIEPLGAQRFVTKWPIAVPIPFAPAVKKQTILQHPRTVPAQEPDFGRNGGFRSDGVPRSAASYRAGRVSRRLVYRRRMPLIQIDRLPVREIFPGLRARLIHTDRVSHSWVEIDAGAAFPEHQHPHEQIVSMIAGELESDGGRRQAPAGAGPGLRHPARGAAFGPRADGVPRARRVRTRQGSDYR